MNKFIPTDENTVNLLRNYRRKNGNLHDIFLNYQGNTITAKTLEQLMVSEKWSVEGTYNSYIFPFVNKHHYKQSCWVGWEASSFYEQFTLEGKYIVRSRIDGNTVSLVDYEKKVFDVLEENFEKIFSKSNNFVLSYSRGIDSLVLLSYIMKYGLLDKTKLVYLDNIFDSDKIKFEIEKDKGFPVEVIPFNDIAKYVNQSDPFAFYHYQSIHLSNLLKNDQVLVGLEGNSALLHKWEWVHRVQRKATLPHPYVNSVESINWNLPHSLDFNIISWIEPYGRPWNNKKCFQNFNTPISDHRLLELLPFIDLNDIEPNYVANASLSRKIIQKNVGSALDELIINENNNWLNFHNKIYIKLDIIGKEFLSISANKKRQEISSFKYLKDQLLKAKENNFIDLSTILSLKFNNFFFKDSEIEWKLFN